MLCPLSVDFSSKNLVRVPGWFAVSKIDLTIDVVSFRVVLSFDFLIENEGCFIKGESLIGF